MQSLYLWKNSEKNLFCFSKRISPYSLKEPHGIVQIINHNCFLKTGQLRTY